MKENSESDNSGGHAAPVEGRIRLRQAEKSDEPFLIAVYGTTREAELAVVPWTDEQRNAFVAMQYAAQSDHYSRSYPESRQLLIYLDDEAVGRLYINRGPEEIRILDLTVMPSSRGRGIGDFLIGELKREAAGVGKPLTIYVESFNPSMQFFENRRFAPIGQQGVHVLMAWSGDDATTE